MKLSTEVLSQPDSILVTIHGDHLDAGNAKAFKEAIQPALDGYAHVLIDMQQLTFVDSSGLGALLSCLRAMVNKSGQLKLIGLAKPVQALFELVRMHRIFSIYATRDEAVATL
jgi:anti-sigma B factor antagonist